MAKYMFGTSGIEMGDIAGDGGMGDTLVDVGDIYKDTAEMVDEDPTITEHYSETKSAPILTIEKAGKTTIKFSIVDLTPANAAKFIGGTPGTATIYSTLPLPNTAPLLEKSLKIKTSDGGYIEVPRCKIVGKKNFKFSAANMLMIDVTATVLQPTKAGVSAMTIANLT
jgi:hypothetical protein